MRGFQLSIFGGVIFFAGLLLLLVIPVALPIAVILIGGTLVWGGFIWTIFGRYFKRPPRPGS